MESTVHPSRILTKKLSDYSDRELAEHILRSKHLDSIDPTMVELARRLKLSAAERWCLEDEIERLSNKDPRYDADGRDVWTG